MDGEGQSGLFDDVRIPMWSNRSMGEGPDMLAAGRFCGIAWNNVGITRFQLPAKSAEVLLRLSRFLRGSVVLRFNQ